MKTHYQIVVYGAWRWWNPTSSRASSAFSARRSATSLGHGPLHRSRSITIIRCSLHNALRISENAERARGQVGDDSRQVKWRGIRSTTTRRSWKPRGETELICDFTVMAVSFYNVAENSGIEWKPRFKNGFEIAYAKPFTVNNPLFSGGLNLQK